MQQKIKCQRCAQLLSAPHPGKSQWFLREPAPRRWEHLCHRCALSVWNCLVGVDKFALTYEYVKEGRDEPTE